MKKVLFVMAVAGMFGFAACNSNKTAEEATETMTETVEAVAEESTETVENAVEEVTETVENAASEVAAQ